MNPLQKLTALFTEFPGIGPRQAKRFVYFLLTRPEGYIRELSDLITKIKDDVKMCTSCYRFFLTQASQSSICPICADTNRDTSLLTVVSRDVDFENIEKTIAYRGFYFILGGTVPILEQSPEKKIRLNELLHTIESRAKQDLKEVILAMNANSEGEHTGDFLKKTLEPLAKKYGLKVSMLGRGLSTGTELEYSDSETLKNALHNRQ